MLKKILAAFNRKSHSPAFDLLSYVNFDSIGWHEVKAAMAWWYFAQVQPIWRGVNLITNEAMSLDFAIQNVKTGDYIKRGDNHPLAKMLELLKKPSPMKSGSEFIKEIGSAFLTCGEFYLCVTGVLEPREIYYVNPKEVTLTTDGHILPKSFIWSNELGSIEFFRQPDFTYATPDGTKKFYQSIDFNPFWSPSNPRGFSRLSAIYFEVEQYIQGNIHNIANLKRGARPAGALICQDDISPDQIKIIKEQVMKFYAGGSNAGNVMVLSKGREFKPMTLTNLEMDYVELNKQAKDAVYQTLEIPASFFDNSASTFNNKLNDRVNLYIFAVLPLMRRLCEELTEFLIPLFTKGKDVGVYRVAIIEREIPALEPMFDESNLKKAQSGVFTINEMRERYGLDDVGEEGDVIYQPMNLFPLGEKPEDKKAGKQPTEQDNENKKKRFQYRMKALGYNERQTKAMLDVIDRQ